MFFSFLSYLRHIIIATKRPFYFYSNQLNTAVLLYNKKQTKNHKEAGHISLNNISVSKNIYSTCKNLECCWLININ